MYFITQRNLLSQSYHRPFSNKYEVHTWQYDGSYVTKKKGPSWNWTRGSRTHTDIERKWRKQMIMTALLDTAAHQECYKCLLFKWVLHSGSVLSCLARNKNDRRESSISDVGSTLGCFPCLQSDLMKRRTFGQLELQTGRQWVKVSLCPLGTDNVHSILSPFFSSTPHNLSLHSPPHPPLVFVWVLRWTSTSLGILAGGALCLRGWGGPWSSLWRKTQK